MALYKDFYKDTWESFETENKNKKIILFGASKGCTNHIKRLKEKVTIVGIVDNNQSKWGTKIDNYEIQSPDCLKELNQSIFSVFITSTYIAPIARQLESLKFYNYYSLMYLDFDKSKIRIKHQTEFDTIKIEALKELLYDQKSKEIVNGIIERRKVGFSDYTELWDSSEYFRKDFLKFHEEEVFVDCGAFTGDTIGGFISTVDHKYKHIYAFEPDKINYEVLENKIKEDAIQNIDLFNYGVWDQEETLNFVESGTVSSKIDYISEGTSIHCIKLDDMIKSPITFVKMDIEGAEINGILGSEKLIKQYKPNLAICLYHNPDDLWEIPLLIHSLVPEYRMIIRHHSYFGWDTVLYATVR